MPRRLTIVFSLLTLALTLAGCGSEAPTEKLTISIQAPQSGPLKERGADMLRAAQLELDAVHQKAAGYELRLVIGPVQGSVVTIDALNEAPQREDGQLMISLAPPVERDTGLQGGRDVVEGGDDSDSLGGSMIDEGAPKQIWLLPPQKTAEVVARAYARSGAPGARHAMVDNPLRAGTPGGRYVTAALAAHEYPPPGSAFYEKYEEKFGHAPDRWSIYAYEAVGLVIDAITRLKEKGVPATQRTVAAEALSIKDRFSPVGHYDVLPSGQTTLYTFQARGAGAPEGPAAVMEAMR
jgi:hypothetical protein